MSFTVALSLFLAAAPAAVSPSDIQPPAEPTAAPAVVASPMTGPSVEMAAPEEQATPTPAPTPAPAPAPPTEKPQTRLLVMSLVPDGVDAATASTITALVTTGLSAYPLDVIGTDDMKAMMQLQANREAMGCSEDASCMAEIADALGAQLVVFGRVGTLNSQIVITLNLFDSDKVKGAGRVIVQAENLKRVPGKLRPKLRTLMEKYFAEHGLTMPPDQPGEVGDLDDTGPWPYALGISGAALVVGGVAAGVVGLMPLMSFRGTSDEVNALEASYKKDGNADDLKKAQALQKDLDKSAADWNAWGFLATDIGFSAAAVGAALLTTGLVWGLSEDDSTLAAPASTSTSATSSATQGATP